MRESGLADLLPSLPETVYVGVSAGSMVTAPIFGETYDDSFCREPPARIFPSATIERWDWLTLRCFRTWITRIPGKFHGQRGKIGRRSTRADVRH